MARLLSSPIGRSMANQLYIGLYSGTTGAMLADWSPRVTRASMSTNKHGFKSLSVTLRMGNREALRLLQLRGLARVVVGSHRGVVWEGRLEDITVRGDEVDIEAFGYWRAFFDVPFTGFFSAATSAGWREYFTGSTTPHKFEWDNNNRIYITYREGETYQMGEGLYIGLSLPHKSDSLFSEITFDYEFYGPANDIEVILYSYNEAMNVTTSQWGLTSSGILQGGTASISMLPREYHLAFNFKNSTLGSVTGPETGTYYFKATNLRITGTVGAAPVTADKVVQSVLAYVHELNPTQISVSLAGINTNDADLDILELVYEDKWPGDIILEMAQNASSSTAFQAAVWEDQRLVFQPVDHTRRHTWCADLGEIELEQSLDLLVNSAYGVYEDSAGIRRRTALVTDAESLAQWGITRARAVSSSTSSESRSEQLALDFVSANKDGPPRAHIELRHLAEPGGTTADLWRVRAGDFLEIRNLPPALPDILRGIRLMRIEETSYDIMRDVLTVVPSWELTTLREVLGVSYPPSLSASSGGGPGTGRRW